MARIFRQKYTGKTTDGHTVTKQSRKWYVEYRDGQGIRRRVPGYTDKQATTAYAAELERRAAHEQSGLVDRFHEHRKRPLAEHLADWRQAVAANGNTPKHVSESVSRAGRVLSGCRFTFWADIAASKIGAFLADLRRGGLSIVASNHHLQAVKQFARWMVQDGRAPDHCLTHLQAGNSRTDRRHDRRALNADEIRRLLDATRNGPGRFGMSGSDRHALYLLSLESGLRARELASLRWSDFDLAGDPPTLTVRAAYAKNRRTDSLPLRAATVQFLAHWRDSRGRADATAPVFAKMPEKTAKMLRPIWLTRASSTEPTKAYATSMP